MIASRNVLWLFSLVVCHISLYLFIQCLQCSQQHKIILYIIKILECISIICKLHKMHRVEKFMFDNLVLGRFERACTERLYELFCEAFVFSMKRGIKMHSLSVWNGIAMHMIIAWVYFEQCFTWNKIKDLFVYSKIMGALAKHIKCNSLLAFANHLGSLADQ